MAKELLGKALVQSTEFWFHTLWGALQVVNDIAGTGLIPPPIGPIVQTVVGILLRRYKTTQPVTSVLPPTH